MPKSPICVEVVYATPQTQAIRVVRLDRGATAAQAIGASGLLAVFPEIDLSRQAIGIFGSLVGANATLNDGDRVEIYRPLLVDPKERRRERARRERSARARGGRR